MLDALEAYLDGGGRLMYLGGNGFYWVTAVDAARPHVVEVRRGQRGHAAPGARRPARTTSASRASWAASGASAVGRRSAWSASA